MTPSLTYNTVDNPVNPTHGRSLFLSASAEGGPLGGNVNTLSDVIEAKYFRPHYHKRNVDRRALSGSVRIRVRRQKKPFTTFSIVFYLGGEDNLRGFDIRTGFAWWCLYRHSQPTPFTFTDPAQPFDRAVRSRPPLQHPDVELSRHLSLEGIRKPLSISSIASRSRHT